MKIISAYRPDDGPVFQKKNMGRVFEPFYTTKEPGEGTGLGLSLSRSIILEHNGRMTVESEPGRGAMFIIDLPVIIPCRPKAVLGYPRPPEKAPPKKQLRILVVDDESSVRYVLERVLKTPELFSRYNCRCKNRAGKNRGRGKLRCNTYRHQNARYERDRNVLIYPGESAVDGK